MWQVLIQPVVDLVSSHFKNKAEEKKAIHERKLNAIQNEADWDALQAKNAGESWKDEFLLVILCIPLVLAFIPQAVPYVEAGFIVLDRMPDYYKVFVGAAVASSFGIKQLSKWGR